jgi:addiction module HigA family antidote
MTRHAPIHPGEILKEEFMLPLALSANRLASSLKVPANRISAIIAQKRSITADTALRLGKVFGTTPEFWMNLQSRFDLETARDTLSESDLEDIERLHESEDA